MTGASEAAIVANGIGRDLVAAGPPGAIVFELRSSDLTLALSGAFPIVANYRDVTTLVVDQGRLLMEIGGGAVRLLVEGLGDKLGLVVGEMRERRARQMLHDRFVEVSSQERLELVEYRIGDEHGVAQLAYHEWGVALLPIDERRPWRLVRRADIAAVTADGSSGSVSVATKPRPGSQTGPAIELLSLGDRVERQRQRMAGLRDHALGDAAALVARLMPDAPFAARQQTSAVLVDGRPSTATELGDAWPLAERAILVDPTFAASYQALVARGTLDGQLPRAWIALTPRLPTVAGAPTAASTDAGESDYYSWFFVALPGNLVAFELVSEGSHATYLYRVVPRAQYRGEAPTELADAVTAAVFDVSECLIDTRFLREPIYLTDSALADPKYTRYRFAIAALPTLRAARWRFVGRLMHRDDASWSASLDDAITFNSATKDDAAVWPGGAVAATDADDAVTEEAN